MGSPARTRPSAPRDGHGGRAPPHSRPPGGAGSACRQDPGAGRPPLASSTRLKRTPNTRGLAARRKLQEGAGLLRFFDAFVDILYLSGGILPLIRVPRVPVDAQVGNTPPGG